MTTSGFTRKGLNTRIREALDAECDVEWGIDFDTDRGGALRYHVEQAGEVYFFTPGECARWLGLDTVCEGCGQPIRLDEGVWIDPTGGDVCAHDLVPADVPDGSHVPVGK